jgi:hypothetical protein
MKKIAKPIELQSPPNYPWTSNDRVGLPMFSNELIAKSLVLQQG